MGTLALAATTAPSKSNTLGSLAGLISGIAVAKLTSAGVIAIIASTVGLPPALVVTAIGIIVTSLVNYLVTHFAEVKTVNDLLKALPNTYQEYPGDPKPVTTTTNINKGT